MKFLPVINENTLSSGLSESAELRKVRKSVLQVVLIIASVIGTAAYFSNIFTLIASKSWIPAAVQTGGFAFIVVLTIADRLPFNIRLHGFLTAAYALAVSDLLQSGLAGEGRLFMMAFVLLGLILLPFRAGMWVFTISILTVGGIGAGMSLGLIPAPDPATIDSSASPTAWLTGGMLYFLLVIVVMAGLFFLIRNLERSITSQKSLADRLEQEQQNLEKRVRERTIVLDQRTKEMELSSTFSRGVSRLTELDDLLTFAADFAVDQLNLSQAAIYLLDQPGEYFVLMTARGKIAAGLKDQQAKVRINQPDSIAQLALAGTARPVVNTLNEVSFFRHPVLETLHSMMVLPIHINSQVTGAVVYFFNDETVSTKEEVLFLQTLVDQFAVALEKARLMSNLKMNLNEYQARGREMTQKAWRAQLLRSGRRTYAYRYNRERLESGVAQSAEAGTAFQQARLVRKVQAGENGEKPSTVLAVPIMLRDQPFGVIDIQFAGDTVSSDVIELIVATTRRLALALDNARLVEQIQTRAEREHTVSDIAARVRASGDIDSILKTAAAEIGRSLGASEVLVQLRSDQ